MTLNETKTPFEFVLVDFAKGEHQQPPHLARQPFGQVPSLDDDGFELYESRAMARYIDGKCGGPLTPKDGKPGPSWSSQRAGSLGQDGRALSTIAPHWLATR